MDDVPRRRLHSILTPSRVIPLPPPPRLLPAFPPCSTGFVVADMAASANPLQSVTESSTLEEFMAVASLAERDFTAERGAVSFVSHDAAVRAAGR
jgi:hypothetical protein